MRTTLQTCGIAASLLVYACFAQSPGARVSARPVIAGSSAARTVIFKDLPKAPPQTGAIRGSIPRFSPFTAEQEQVARDAAYHLMQQQSFTPATPPPLGTAGVSKIISPPAANDETSCGSFIPSDAGLAASASYLVELDNSCMKILNPATGAVISGPTPLPTFFGSGAKTGDPRALFDAANSRFIVAAHDFTNNRILLAVSQSSNPTLKWNQYVFNSAVPGTCAGATGDFPMIGQTNQEPGDPKGAVYLSWNIFCPGPTFSTAFVGAISKTKLYAGATATPTGFINLSAEGANVDTIQPVNVFVASDRPRGEFLLNSFNFNFGGTSCKSGCTGVVLWNFYNGIPATGSSQQLTSVVVSTTNKYMLSPQAPEPGCAVMTCGPNTGYPVFGAEVNYVSGTIFAALNNGMGILILELDPSVDDSGAIAGGLIRNEICFACGGFSDGGQAYYGGIQPDSERNWTLVYNYSAPGVAMCTPSATCVYPSPAYLTHRVTQAPNTLFDSGFTLIRGQAFYRQLDSLGTNRWGDYTAGAATLLKLNSYWFDAQFVESNGNWGKVIAKDAYTSPTQP